VQITFDEAVRFFVAVTASSSCYVCKADKWEIPFHAENNKLCFLIPVGARQGGVGAHNLNLECTSCGLIRTHRAETMREWLDANPLEGGGEIESV
jgi:hypothetical protein